MTKLLFALTQGMICLTLTGTALAQWSSDPNVGVQVDNETKYFQSDISLMPDNQGGAVVCWYNLTTTDPTIGSVLKRITSEGEVQWDAANTACYSYNDWDVVSDGAGGAYLVRSAADINSHYLTYVQHISSSGLKLWGPDGIRVTTLYRDYQQESNVAITRDCNGGIIVVWTDNRDGLNPNFFAQKLNANGERQWGDGVRLSQANTPQSFPSIISDSNGGAIVCWADSRNGVGSTDVYAQRVSNTGQVLWNADDITICNAAGYQRGPRLLPDGQGGALALWEDTRTGRNSFYAHRFDGNGAAVWPANGVAVSTDTRTRYYGNFLMTSTGIYLTFTNLGNSLPNEIRLQKMDFATGDRLWGNSGLLVPNTQKCHDSNIQDDGAGGLITAWCDSRTTDQVQLYAQRVSDSGDFQWDLNGMPVCTATNADCGEIAMLNVAPGECIVAWSDQRNDPGFSYPKSQVHSAYLQSNGTLRGTTAARDWQLWQ